MIAPLTLDPAKWTDALLADEGEMTEQKITDWFHAAIQAGYNAARPLNPDVIQIEVRS